MAIEVAEIARVSALVGELARRDVSDLSDGAFMEAHDAVARLERLVGTLGARFAGDLARRSAPALPGGGLARRQGFGNAGAMVARVTGGTTAGAMRAIEAGRALMPAVESLVVSPDGSALSEPATAESPYPAVAEAARAGDLSVDAAGLITAGLESIADRVPSERLHELERRLVGKAVHLAAHEVRRLVTTAVARADLAGHEERERRQHAERYVAWKEDHTGMVTFTGRLDAVTAAPIRTVIEQIVTHDFRARRDQDPADQDQRTVGQMRADALFQICRHALGCDQTDRSGVRTAMIVRIDERDLATGRGLGRIDGTHQPVSVGNCAVSPGTRASSPKCSAATVKCLTWDAKSDSSRQPNDSHFLNATVGAPNVMHHPNTAKPTTFAGGKTAAAPTLPTGSCFAPDATTTSTAKAGTSWSKAAGLTSSHHPTSTPRAERDLADSLPSTSARPTRYPILQGRALPRTTLTCAAHLPTSHPPTTKPRQALRSLRSRGRGAGRGARRNG